MHRRGVLSTFCIFHVFEICGKMAEKTQQKRYPQKTSKNEAQGGPELTQNGSEFIEKSSEIEKTIQKT